MKTISQAVLKIVDNDTIIKPLGKRGLINVSQYAKSIKSAIEDEMQTSVSNNSIQLALNRYFKSDKAIADSSFTLGGLQVHTNLTAISFERTNHSSKFVQNFHSSISEDPNSFITITQGINEVTIVADTDSANRFNQLVSEDISIDAIYIIDGLVGVTVKAELDYINKPNYFHTIISRLAIQNINIIEAVSTATETTFIIAKSDLQSTLTQLQSQLK